MFRPLQPSMNEVERELRAREPIFHHRERGISRTDFDEQTSADFWEVGASGQQYGREEIWSVLESRYAENAEEAWQVDEFLVRPVGHDTYLVTYLLLQDSTRLTRRSTLWEKADGRWRAIYHQGTLVSPD